MTNKVKRARDPARGLVRVVYERGFSGAVIGFDIEVRVGPIWVSHTAQSGGEDDPDEIVRAGRANAEDIRDRIRLAVQNSRSRGGRRK